MSVAIQLPAQVGDERFYDGGGRVVIDAPHRLQEMRLREHLPGVQHESVQQPKLRRRELYFESVMCHGGRSKIDDDVTARYD